jgi:hypothetical protein
MVNIIFLAALSQRGITCSKHTNSGLWPLIEANQATAAENPHGRAWATQLSARHQQANSTIKANSAR